MAAHAIFLLLLRLASSCTPVETSTLLDTLVRCASGVRHSLAKPDSEVSPKDKLNAFKFDQAAGTCTLGRVPYTSAFLAQLPMVADDVADSVYTITSPCEVENVDPSTVFLHMELLEDAPADDLSGPDHLYLGRDDLDNFSGNWDFSRQFIDGRIAFRVAATVEEYAVHEQNVETLTSLFVTAWIYSEESVGHTQMILTSVVGMDWHNGFRVYLNNGAFPKFVGLAIGQGAGQIYVQSADGIVPSGRWVHVGVIYDHDQGTVTYYMDGVQASSTVTSVAQVMSSMSDTYLGMFYNIADQMCECDLADLQIHWVALDASQVLAIYKRFGQVCL